MNEHEGDGFQEPVNGIQDMAGRDLFAMAALQGLLSGPTMIKSEKLAEFAYQIADAMLVQREKPIQPLIVPHGSIVIPAETETNAPA